MIPATIPPALRTFLTARLSPVDMAIFEAMWAAEAQQEALAQAALRLRNPPSAAAMLRRAARKLDRR